MNNSLHTSQAVVWQDTCYVIKAIKPTLGDIVLEAKGGVERTVDIRAFYNYIASGEIKLAQREIEATQRSWTASEQREADFRQQLLELKLALERQGLDQPARDVQLDAFCLQYPSGHHALRD
jgi:putative transposase